MEISLEQLREMVAAALFAKFGGDSYNSPLYCVASTYPDYVIAYGPNADLYKISFTVGGDGDGDGDADDITLGDPQLVDVAYVPVTEAASFQVMEGAALIDDGWTWPVQIIAVGPAGGSLNNSAIPHVYTPAVVAQIAEAANGARFGRRHAASGENPNADPSRIAGWFSDCKVVKEAAVGLLHLLKTETEIRERLMAAREAQKMDLFNLSVDAYVGFKVANHGAKQVMESTKLAKLSSIDMVAEAGAGGKFLHVLNSREVMHDIHALQNSAIKKVQPNGGENAGREKGAAMKDRIKKVLEALRKHDAGRATQLTTKFEGLKEDKHADFFAEVSEALADASNPPVQSGETGTQHVQEAKAVLEEAKKLQTKNTVVSKVQESKLPKPAQNLVIKRFENKIATEAEIDAEITSVREAFAAAVPTGRVGGVVPITVGLNGVDKVQLAMDRMCGVTELGQRLYAERNGIEQLKPEPGLGFRSVKEAYIFCTGDTNLQFGMNGIGGFTKVSEAISTSSFPNLLLNSMTKRLLQDWAGPGMNGLDQLYYTAPGGLPDYKSQDRVRMGYLGDLSTVSEAGTYTEFTPPTDERVSYAATKRGNIITISRETILGDDLNKITQIPGRITRAAKRTLKQFITNFFVNNTNYGVDSVSWFNVTHNNLSTNPLSIDELNQREIAIFNQTEKDSNKPLGLTLDWIMVNIGNKAIAYQINQAQTYTLGPNMPILPNPWYHRFGPNNERIIVNELTNDLNDWWYGTLPTNAPFLEIGFIGGQEEPQLFLANEPTQGTAYAVPCVGSFARKS